MNYQRHLIITGFARSGTSVLAQFLNLCGYDTGGSWNSELNAGFEDEHFQKIITTFQSNPLSEELILLLMKEIGEIDKKVIKHPRILLNPEFIRIWTLIYLRTTILVTYREPFHAVESKKAHSDTGYFTNLSPTELDQKFHAFIDMLIHLRIRHHILYFPDFLNNYNEVFHTLSSLGILIDKDKGRNIWDSLIDFNKVHFK